MEAPVQDHGWFAISVRSVIAVSLHELGRLSAADARRIRTSGSKPSPMATVPPWGPMPCEGVALERM